MPRSATNQSLRHLASVLAVAVGLVVLAPASLAGAEESYDVTLSVVKVEPAVEPNVGAASVTVTNHPSDGAAQNVHVFVSDNGFPAGTTVTVADGATSAPIRFTGTRGTWRICTDASPQHCIAVVVPDGTADAYNGTVVFNHSCDGLRYTVTNTSDRDADFAITTTGDGLRGPIERWTLKPGASGTGGMPRWWDAKAVIDVGEAGGGWSEHLATETWQVPTNCPMLGGTSLVKWVGLKQGHPAAVVRTKALCPVIGFQTKGKKRINWAGDFRGERTGEMDCPVPGRQQVWHMGVYLKPGQAITIRMWVKYVDESWRSDGRGLTRVTGWRTFRRS